MMFDHMAAAQRVGIPGDKLERLVALARAEFPDDETMVEHEDASLEEILRQDVSLRPTITTPRYPPVSRSRSQHDEAPRLA